MKGKRWFLNAMGRSSLTGMGNMKKAIKRMREDAFQTFHIRLVSDPSCSYRAYPSGWSFNHLLSRQLNYQAAPMHVKPPIEVVLGLMQIGSRSGEFAFAPC